MGVDSSAVACVGVGLVMVVGPAASALYATGLVMKPDFGYVQVSSHERLRA